MLRQRSLQQFQGHRDDASQKAHAHGSVASILRRSFCCFGAVRASSKRKSLNAIVGLEASADENVHEAVHRVIGRKYIFILQDHN